ncbi:VC1465 family Xer recombination activation factor [Xanthomonadaceae bacterium XH05]|nr:VC1465 family Xer recombination activation factor [Xanthomonadaceae bacterium XH05]
MPIGDEEVRDGTQGRYASGVWRHLFYIIYIMHKSTKTTKRPDKSAKSRKINKITGDRFRIARQACWLTLPQAAKVLQVTERTLHNWEAGTCRVPYAAYKLIRLMAGGHLKHLCPTWDGWTLRPGKLISPEGREFSAGDMGWLSLLVARARLFSDLVRKVQAERKATDRHEPEAHGLAGAVRSSGLVHTGTSQTGLPSQRQTRMVEPSEVLPSVEVPTANRGLKWGSWYQLDTNPGAFFPVWSVKSCAIGSSSNTSP